MNEEVKVCKVCGVEKPVGEYYKGKSVCKICEWVEKNEALDIINELSKEEESVANTEQFIKVVKKYTEIKELTPTILNEFIEKIVIHAPVKTDGKRTQEIEIYYNSVGVLDLPNAEEMILALKERKRQKHEQQQKTA